MLRNVNRMICVEISVEMGFMSFLSEIISSLLDKGPQDEAEISHSKFVSGIVDTLKSQKASDEDMLQALRDLGAVVYVGQFTVHQYSQK